MIEISMVKFLAENNDFSIDSWSGLIDDKDYSQEYSYTRIILQYIYETKSLKGMPLKMYEILSKKKEAKDLITLINDFAKEKKVKI